MTTPRTSAPLLPAKGSLLALDVSKRRIGIAGTDQERRLATPVTTIERRGRSADLDRLAPTVRERRAVGLVIGLPINMDGSEGPMAKAMRAEAARWPRALGATGAAAGRAAVDLRGRGRDRRRAAAAAPQGPAPVDHYAAMVILEDALRALHQ